MRISDWSSDVCSSDLDLLHLRIEAEIDPLHRRNLEQPIADLLVIAAQQRARTVHDGHMAAELVEDARKFIGDIAAAHDHDPLRALLQMEKLVGGDAMFRALDVGNEWPCPGDRKRQRLNSSHSCEY